MVRCVLRGELLMKELQILKKKLDETNALNNAQRRINVHSPRPALDVKQPIPDTKDVPLQKAVTTEVLANKGVQLKQEETTPNESYQTDGNIISSNEENDDIGSDEDRLQQEIPMRSLKKDIKRDTTSSKNSPYAESAVSHSDDEGHSSEMTDCDDDSSFVCSSPDVNSEDDYYENMSPDCFGPGHKRQGAKRKSRSKRKKKKMRKSNRIRGRKRLRKFAMSFREETSSSSSDGTSSEAVQSGEEYEHPTGESKKRKVAYPKTKQEKPNHWVPLSTRPVSVEYLSDTENAPIKPLFEEIEEAEHKS